MDLKEKVGINLKYYRYQSGLSQEKFYTKLGLSYKYLAAVENITSDYIDEIAFKLGIRSEDLTTFNESHVIHKRRIDAKEKIGS